MVKPSQVAVMIIRYDYGVLTLVRPREYLPDMPVSLKVSNGPSSVEGVKSVAFSPDGKTLASGGGDNVIHLWDIDTGEINRTLIGHTHWVFSLAFSPDGKILASGSVDSDIRLWDPHTGEHKKTLTGHTAWVRSIAFSPDGKTLVSGSDDGTVLIWEIDP